MGPFMIIAVKQVWVRFYFEVNKCLLKIDLQKLMLKSLDGGGICICIPSWGSMFIIRLNLLKIGCANLALRTSQLVLGRLVLLR